MSMNYTRTSMSLGLGLLVLSGAGMVGCRGERTDKPPRQLFPDMDDQEHFRPQAETEFFAGLSPLALAIGDFNEDGSPDVVITDSLSGAVSVLPSNP